MTVLERGWEMVGLAASRLRQLLNCRRGVHRWSWWAPYCCANELAHCLEVGMRRDCLDCPESQYKRVVFDAIDVPQPKPWE